LQVFFKKHPEFVKNDFFITGESYAGHYIPAFASRVHQGNKANEGIHINFKVRSVPKQCIYSLLIHCYITLSYLKLQGFAIGNGLTDPAIQYKAYTDYALDMNLIQKADYERINKFIPPCEFAIKLCGQYYINSLDLHTLFPIHLHKTRAFLCYCTIQVYIFLSDELPAN
jgi:vitellogenic carboxypeptidase-like protein/serine carboxypeptidase-like clade 4